MQTVKDVNPGKKHRKIPGLIRFLVVASLFWIGFYFWPILIDSTPPVLEVSGLEANRRYRGTLTLNITVTDDRPGLGSLTVQVDDGPPHPLSLVADNTTFWTLETSAFADGLHTVFVTATDKALRKNRTQHTLPFYIDSTAPQLQIPPGLLHVGQGRTLAIFVQTDEPLSEITGEFSDREITFHPIGPENLYRSLLGIGVTHAPQSYPLTLRAVDLVGNAMTQTFQVEVGKTTFLRGGYIVLSPEKQKVMMDKLKSREDNAKRGAAFAKAPQEQKQLWEGKFIRSAEGRLTSPFGKYREYNTGVRRHHLGTDIANVVGTPVYAGNHGIVTLADRLHIYGNAVVINHGQGISTSYNHLNELHVQVGDRINKGQRIGLMGATGQVTGSHLHWHMVVNGVAVAPEEWTEIDFSSPERER